MRRHVSSRVARLEAQRRADDTHWLTTLTDAELDALIADADRPHVRRFLDAATDAELDRLAQAEYRH